MMKAAVGVALVAVSGCTLKVSRSPTTEPPAEGYDRTLTVMQAVWDSYDQRDQRLTCESFEILGEQETWRLFVQGAAGTGAEDEAPNRKAFLDFLREACR